MACTVELQNVRKELVVLKQSSRALTKSFCASRCLFLCHFFLSFFPLDIRRPLLKTLWAGDSALAATCQEFLIGGRRPNRRLPATLGRTKDTKHEYRIIIDEYRYMNRNCWFMTGTTFFFLHPHIFTCFVSSTLIVLLVAFAIFQSISPNSSGA